MFPAKYQGAMFIARHGPWNRTKKYADVSVAWPDGKGGAKVEPFMTGFVENNSYLGRPVDFLVMKDGSLLVSDDHAGRSTASATASDGVPGAGSHPGRPHWRWWPWLRLRCAGEAKKPAARERGKRRRSCGGPDTHSASPALRRLSRRERAAATWRARRSWPASTRLLAITQLFLFREGRRSNEAMTAVAKTLKDDDLRGFSDSSARFRRPAPAPRTPPTARA
jgi:hypothetical protein